MKRYGKEIKPILKHKQDFFDNNEILLTETQRSAKIYTNQPYRINCKICQAQLDNYDVSFIKQDVEYRVCNNCGHLNGIYEDTNEYAEAIYQDEEYANQYREESKKKYFQRMRDIYLPKVEFMFDTLELCGENPFQLKYADFGSGSGYLIAALNNKGVREATGYEMSLPQTEFAKKINNSKAFINIDMKELYNIAETTVAQVVTMVGVIEHLQYPMDIMHSLFKNKNVKNILITFPMFSPSVFFEMVFPTVMPRHLAGGHTHLFSEQSIDHLLEETGFVKCSEWWFGTDVMDLIRSVDVRTRQINKDNSAAKTWRETMDDLVDELQLVLDKHHVASQVHMLLKK